MGVERQPAPIGEPNQVLVISHDVVGSRMAGPGIRYWELSRVLAQHFQVTLAAPRPVDVDASGVELWPYRSGDWETLAPVVQKARVIVLNGDILNSFPALLETETPLVVDGYDPHTLETLALFAGSPQQGDLHRQRERILQWQCRVGDFFLCASERQRDWWLGLLEATGRINAYTYGEDPSLRRLVDVVPFGLPASPLEHRRQVLKGVWSGIAHDDKVILWGGGLWQWLDPLTAIRAMARVTGQRQDVRLVFPGTRHPHTAAVPAMPVHEDAVRLAKGLGLLNRSVFFGDWVSYEQWPSYLAESDIGLSLHRDTVEARLAFRSRVLDYVWAGLPMVLTAGDATSELVMQYGLGETVPFEDAAAVSQALLRVLDLPPETLAADFGRARAALAWERAAAPLVAFCREPRRAPDKSARYEPPLSPEETEKLAAEAARLREIVRGYESGRFIRFMKWLHRMRG